MITKDEAIKAAETLKEWCGGKLCNNCPFGIKEDEGEYRCYFALGGFPARWKIPKACRWTKTDLELAKVLKKAGSIKVFRARTEDRVLWESNNQLGFLPGGSFNALSPGESVDLDTIIQEAKED